MCEASKKLNENTPELFLFLSVDVIESTRLKYSSKISQSDNTIESKDGNSRTNSKILKSNIEWIDYFTYFFENFPKNFKQHLDETKNINGSEIIEDINITPWKYSGDEILFYTQFTTCEEVHKIILAFKRTLEDWGSEKVIYSDHLKLKATAWIGQFPYIDKKIRFDKNILNIPTQSDVTENNKKLIDNNYSLDFIGPSIDCGFRIGKHASNRGIVMSVELVDICRHCRDLYPDIFYIKSEQLKGVLAPTEYPIFHLLLDYGNTPTNKNKTSVEKFLTFATPDVLDAFIQDYYDSLDSKYKGKLTRVAQNADLSVFLNKQKATLENANASDDSIKPLSEFKTVQSDSENESSSKQNQQLFDTLFKTVSENLKKNKLNKY